MICHFTFFLLLDNILAIKGSEKKITDVHAQIINRIGQQVFHKKLQNTDKILDSGGIINSELVLCGGVYQSLNQNDLKTDKECFSLEKSGLKKTTFTMVKKREKASSVLLGNSKLFITGGQERAPKFEHNSSEIFSNGSFKESINLELPVSDHCMVYLKNANKVMVLGGTSDGNKLKETWIIDFENGEPHDVTKGPDMLHKRTEFGCTTLIKDEKDMVIVSGGRGDGNLKSEILEDVQGKWKPRK